jgi:hypothetical protein
MKEEKRNRLTLAILMALVMAWSEHAIDALSQNGN